MRGAPAQGEFKICTLPLVLGKCLHKQTCGQAGAYFSWIQKGFTAEPREMIRGRIFSEMIRIRTRKSELQAKSRGYRPIIRVTAGQTPRIRTESPGKRMGFGCFYRKPLFKAFFNPDKVYCFSKASQNPDNSRTMSEYCSVNVSQRAPSQPELAPPFWIGQNDTDQTQGPQCVASHQCKTSHTGTNKPKFVPSRWGWLPFDLLKPGCANSGGLGARWVSNRKHYKLNSWIILR